MARNLSIVYTIAMLLCVVSASTGAQESTFRVTQVYSNLDGSVQFVELTESAGLNGQHRLAGLTLTSTHNGVVKRFTFKDDLPTDQTAHMSIVVSVDRWLPVDAIDESWGGCPCHIPDVQALPFQFIATDGGTLEFAGIDRISYTALPTDGVTALYRDGTVRQASVPSNGRCHAAVICATRYNIAQSWVYAIEYYHAASDHYFVSASAPDIDALDAGHLTGWQRTGKAFSVGAGSNTFPGYAQPVCRFYIPPGQGDSHFLSAAADECDAVRAKFPGFVVESEAAFYAALPHPVTGACPDRVLSIDVVLPVYRLWNGRADSNHRYTTDAFTRDEMRRLGWMSEGYGPEGVAFCVPEYPWSWYVSAFR